MSADSARSYYSQRTTELKAGLFLIVFANFNRTTAVNGATATTDELASTHANHERT